ncbi:hexokinase-domain-containing protein [Fennellomyces sp. T-0311]|nr:hexokinase-domain-containing protein [Fennellomyces sp. T-0311]
MRSLLHRFRSRRLSPSSGVHGNGVRKVDVTEAPPKSPDESAAIVDELNRTFDVSLAQMKNISERLKEEMKKGLEQEGATVAMIPTFVSLRPTGEEKGRYLALDLGGTYLRICDVELRGSNQFTTRHQKYKVPLPLKEGDFRDLCDFIAECLDTFITDMSIRPTKGEVFQLGFTFSFPVFQTDINRGVLKQWTKGYTCTNSVHKDVVEILQDAFLRKKVPVNIAAIVNDAVGALMALAYNQPDTAIGVILGTGTNACYYEKMDGIKKWDGGETISDEMAINTEWGAFDCERAVLPMTIHDSKVDRESNHPRQQIFEKMISGMYIGEVTRNCILHLIDRQILFNGYSSSDLNRQYSFETSYMSTIEMDTAPDLPETRHVLEDILSIPSTTLMDRQLVKKLCEIVGRRAARLSACGLAAVLKQSKLVSAGCTIGIDGSLFEHYPGFETNMMLALKELFGPYIVYKVKLALARDGSGVGAAICAMLAHKATQVQKSRSVSEDEDESEDEQSEQETVQQEMVQKDAVQKVDVQPEPEPKETVQEVVVEDEESKDDQDKLLEQEAQQEKPEEPPEQKPPEEPEQKDDKVQEKQEQ